MRLINTSTFRFKEFTDRSLPPYAILSHTWGKGEVTYQDYVRGAGRKKKGFAKIKKTIEIARANGIRFVWIDTCCIDKTSSAELTEAINSMYRYYERSKVCYAFLSDLNADGELLVELPHCRWFTRGWTLQELVAPLIVQFYDCGWKCRGSKESLSGILSQITGIDEEILLHRRSLRSICVAQKMSWASSRHTTRIEDIAYSLLGIFGVNMPLLYGEEEGAFRRLQEEIIKSSSDLSILAWTDPIGQHDVETSSGLHCGVLAKSPSSFAGASFIRGSLDTTPVGECIITNRGIRLYSAVKYMWDANAVKYYYVLPLHCKSATGEYLGIRLRKIGDETFLRNDPCTLTKYNTIRSRLALRLRYFALEVPYISDTGSALQQHFTEASLIHIRRHILRLQFQSDITTSDYWGCAYDHTDRMFFDTSEQPKKWIALSFTIWSIKSITLLLYVVGWTSESVKDLKYWLVDAKSFAPQLADIYKVFKTWEYDDGSAEFVLEEGGIPRTSKIEVRVPDTNFTNCIWVEPKRTIDRDRCKRPFWTFHIHRELRFNTLK